MTKLPGNSDFPTSFDRDLFHFAAKNVGGQLTFWSWPGLCLEHDPRHHARRLPANELQGTRSKRSLR